MPARLRFVTSNGPLAVHADATVLALGGASWPRLGSDGGWTDRLSRAGIPIASLKPSNVGFVVDWSKHLKRHAGQPLKRIALSFEDRTVRGEIVITETGIEGGAVYALSPPLRDAIEAKREATLNIALRPDIAADEINRRLTRPRGKQSLSTFLRKALNLVAGRNRHCCRKQPAENCATLAPVEIAQPRQRDPTGSSAPRRLLARFRQRAAFHSTRSMGASCCARKPGVFVAGEMLDWEAPTGGYLLQACFATGVAAARRSLYDGRQ